jgi:hypothetical protein
MPMKERYTKTDILWRLKTLASLAAKNKAGFATITTDELQKTINEIQSLRADNTAIRRNRQLL